MALPTSLKPLLCRLDEVLFKGHHIEAARLAGRTIDAHHFQPGYVGKPEDLSSVRSHSHSELRFFAVGNRTLERGQELCATHRQEITMELEWRRYSGHEDRASEPMAVQAEILEDYHLLRGALLYPSNLSRTEDGTDTGIEAVTEISDAAYRWNPSTRLMIGTCRVQIKAHFAWPTTT